jgi:uncharacterized membrane protein
VANDKFTIKEALKYGWDTFKANIPFFIGFMVVMALLTIVPDALSEKIFEKGSVGFIVTKIILRLIGLVLGMISTRISLDIHDTGEPNLSKIGEVAPQIVFYFVGKLLYGLIVLVGIILLIVPGIIVAYMFLYVGYLIIDRNMGPIDALQESRALTDGYKMDLFLFSLVVALINILGVVCLFVGLFVTIPVTLMASVYIYRRLSPAESAAEAA